MKKILSAVLFLTVIFTFSACNKSESGKSETALNPSQVFEKLETVMPENNIFTHATPEYIENTAKISLSFSDAYIFKVCAGDFRIDRYAVFYARNDAAAGQLEKQLGDYITSLKDGWKELDYRAEEQGKLSLAKTETVGRYVAFAILDEETQSAFFEAFEKAVK